jgi:hypothetical protein
MSCFNATAALLCFAESFSLSDAAIADAGRIDHAATNATNLNIFISPSS